MAEYVRSCPMCGDDVAERVTTCPACGEAVPLPPVPVRKRTNWVRRVVWTQLTIPVYFLAMYYGHLGLIPWSRSADAHSVLATGAAPFLGFVCLICLANSDLNENQRSAALISSFIIFVATVILAVFCF